MNTFPTTRHQFNMVHGDDTVCITTTADTLPLLLEKFADYLKACGYYPPEGCHLDFVPADCDHSCLSAPADLEPTEDGREAL
jgi:hypothetical protein